MSKRKVDDIAAEFGMLQDRRRDWEDVWEDIVSYVVPWRSGFGEDSPVQGQRHDDLIYDGTPLAALENYAAGMQGYLLSAHQNWFGIEPENERISQDRESRMWIAYVERVLYSLFLRSNFYRAMHELFKDGGGPGTSTLYTEAIPEKRSIWFSCRHPREIYCFHDKRENVTVVDRYYRMTVSQILESWGRDKEAELHEDFEKDFDKSPYSEHFILHSVRQRADWDPKKLDRTGKRFESVYLDMTHHQIIKEEGYQTNPYSVWRNERSSDEDYGRGPGWRALADIISLNQYVKTDVTAAQLRVNPPLNIPEEQAGDVEWFPGGRNYYSELNRTVAAAETRIDLRAGLDREERKQRIIDRHYLVDFFLMMANAEKEMTAQEVRRRTEEKAIILGPTITGLNQDVLEPLIDRVYNLAIEMKLIPDAPEQLVKFGGQLNINYRGPLAQAQQSFFQQEPYRKTLGDLAGMIGMDPSGQLLKVFDNFNWDYWVRSLAKSNGLPEEVLIEEQMVADMRQARAKQQAQMAQQAQLESLGKATPGLGKAPEEGSILEAMGKQGAA